MRGATQFMLFMLLAAAVLITHAPSPTNAYSGQAQLKLNEAERALVTGSRNAIVRTGMSEAYFDRRFSLVKVVNQSADRRVIWKFSLNEYSTIVTDVIGYYTADGKRVDVHGAATSLRVTSDINKTISRKKADQIMQKCIGRFTNAGVEYRASPNGPARLVLAAEAVPRPEPEQQPTPVNPSKTQPPTDMDLIKPKGKRRPPIIVGAVDLQSGKCTKGELLAGPSVPMSH